MKHSTWEDDGGMVSQEKLGWQDVFDCIKLFPQPYNKCLEIVKSVGYKYLCFNGVVYSVNDLYMENPICKEYR